MRNNQIFFPGQKRGLFNALMRKISLIFLLFLHFLCSVLLYGVPEEMTKMGMRPALGVEEKIHT